MYVRQMITAVVFKFGVHEAEVKLMANLNAGFQLLICLPFISLKIERFGCSIP